MANSERDGLSLSKVATVVGLISTLLGIFITIKKCHGDESLKPVATHEMDGYWSSTSGPMATGQYMYVLFMKTSADGHISGTVDQPCRHEAGNVEIIFDIDQDTSTWDGKQLLLSYADHAFQMTGNLQGDKLIGTRSSSTMQIDTGKVKAKLPEMYDNVELSRGKRGCETDLDSQGANDYDPNKNYPIIGYWHAGQAQLHVINFDADNKVVVTESYPCMDGARASEIDRNTTSWDGTTLKFTLPPIYAPNWKIDGNTAKDAVLRKLPASLEGNLSPLNGNPPQKVRYTPGKLVCSH